MAGSYFQNRLLITISHGVQLVQPGTATPVPVTPATAPLLFHEYCHYLQNVSTVTGYDEFATELNLWWLFRETVSRPTFRSSGSATLTAQQTGWISTLMTAQAGHRGKALSSLGPANLAQFNVTNVNKRVTPIPGTQAQRTVLDIQGNAIDAATGQAIPCSFEFGTHALWEGLAYTLECQLSAQMGAPQLPAPYFPYEVFSALASFIAPGISTQTLVRLGTLSLQTIDPIDSVHQLLSQLNATHANALQIIQGALVRSGSTIGTALGQLNTLRASWAGKGTVGNGIQIVLDTIEQLLQRRIQDPFFDSDFLFSPGTVQNLNTLLSQHPPCLVLQDNGGGTLADLLALNGHVTQAPLSVMHSAFHFFRAHRQMSYFDATATIRPKRCPFYSCCALQLRQQSPAICATEPWSSATWPHWPAGSSCWYSNGVQASAF